MPYGENAIVAVAIYTGYNQDDSILLNETSIKRGMFQTSYYHSYDFQETLLNDSDSTDLLTNTLKIKTEFCNIPSNPKYRETVIRKKDKDYSLLDSDGIIKVGSLVNPNTILVGMITPVFDSVTGIINSFRDTSIIPKKGQHGIVDSIYKYTTNKGTQGTKIRIVELRLPVLGDKFSARHGQKGTCGALIKEEDMPYTSSGLKPDMVVNPHAFPSRMTIGQFIECMSNKVGSNLGCLIDATAFSTQNRILDTKEILIRLGYHPYGNEIMYNGMNGEMMESEIFIGPTYYLRSKLMTEDKINYRDTGPVTALTKQPLEGRAQDGGLRIGEMERDSIISHGISNFLNESLMKRSDGRELLYQPETGLMDANEKYSSSKIEIPYSMRLFIQEIESMHLQIKLLGF
jgi:DNA-directed RNA polymerase II subunit RPB2